MVETFYQCVLYHALCFIKVQEQTHDRKEHRITSGECVFAGSLFVKALYSNNRTAFFACSPVSGKAECAVLHAVE